MTQKFRGVGDVTLKELAAMKGFNLEDLKGIDARLALRDVTEPELAKHIFDYVLNPIDLAPTLF